MVTKGLSVSPLLLSKCGDHRALPQMGCIPPCKRDDRLHFGQHLLRERPVLRDLEARGICRLGQNTQMHLPSMPAPSKLLPRQPQHPIQTLVCLPCHAIIAQWQLA